MKILNALDKKILVISIFPFVCWLSLSLCTLNDLPKELFIPFISFFIFFLLLTIVTSWTNKISTYIAIPLSFIAVIPLYLESQSSSGYYTAKLFPIIAIIFILFYLILNFIKIRRINK